MTRFQREPEIKPAGSSPKNLSIPEVYDRAIGEMWSHLLSKAGLTVHDRIVEVAPGMRPKVGIGLSGLGFEGTLYVVEPCDESLQVVASQYRRLLPRAEIVPVGCKLSEAARHVPAGIDGILSNHPLDDMLLSQLPVDESQLQRFFADNYVGPCAGRTKGLWERLKSDKDFFSRAQDNVITEWREALEALGAKWLAIAQYQSFFFRSHGLSLPDDEAKELLRRLKCEYRKFDYSREIQGVDSPIAEPERWLLLRDLPFSTRLQELAPGVPRAVLTVRAPRGDKNHMILFEASSSIQAQIYNSACAKVIPMAYHQIGTANDKGIHGWEIWSKDVASDDDARTLIPKIHAKAEALARLYRE